MDETDGAKDKSQPFVNMVANRTSGSESIEGISDAEELEDDVFLGYFTVDSDGKKRPIPAPRRLVQAPTGNDQISTPLGEGRTVVIRQREGEELPLVKALDSRTTLRSFVGLEPYRRIRIRAGHESEDLVQDLRNEVSKSGKEVELAEGFVSRDLYLTLHRLTRERFVAHPSRVRWV